MAKELAEEYASSLADLRMNSKPLINMLTSVAEENIVHAEIIVDTIEKHLEKVQADVKLPVLYLVDSIIKNVGEAYIQKFSQCIARMFTKTFKLVGKKARSQMFKLRETWHEVFPSTKMYQLDVKVSLIDPAWPILAKLQQSRIHLKPSFQKMPVNKNPPGARITPVSGAMLSTVRRDPRLARHVPPAVVQSQPPQAVVAITIGVAANEAPKVVENMDVDMRLLPPAIPEATNTSAHIEHKRHPTEVLETRNTKKRKVDVLFGNEDVVLRQLPQVDDVNNVTVSSDDSVTSDSTIQTVPSPNVSPNREDWHEEQYHPPMYQVMQPNKRLKLNKTNISDEEMEMGRFIKKGDNFGDIDEGVVPTVSPPMFMGPLNPRWRAPRPRQEFNGPRGPRPRPFFYGEFDNRGVRNFEPRMPLPPPPPSFGMFQEDSPFLPYEHVETPPYIGWSGASIPPTDMRLLEYIDRDPMKTIEIDGVPREIRFYGETAVVMLNWDDPREIKFLPDSRRITFDNKDSIVLGFNEDYTTAEVDDQVFKIRFGAPTRELYVNGRWYECYFGGPPCGIVIEGVPRMIQLEGPPPQVTICTEKRTDLVAGKINMIVDAKHMCPVFLDAKPQKCSINNVFFTLRFVDSLKTVLINEVPFRVEFGGMPRPLRIGNRKHFIRFSMAPNYVKPGQIQIADMEGKTSVPSGNKSPNEQPCERPMEINNSEEPPQFPEKSLSLESENSNHGGLDILSSVMPTSLAPASQFSGYSLGFAADKIPGLDTPVDETPPTAPSIPLLRNINVNDLFAKLVASGIVPTTKPNQKDDKEKAKTEKPTKESKQVPNDNNKNDIKAVDLLKPKSLRVKQPGIVAMLYGGMQCSSCSVRFPPEHTVRYSQHLDWHFRQNRRKRDFARRAHSRPRYYKLSDWMQYEEIEDLEEREKSWFETAGAKDNTEASSEMTDAETPSVPAGGPQEQYCTLCGDKFDQFYNEDKEEWHLRKAVRHNEQNYHPLCFEDYKASQMKAEAADSTNGSLTEQPSVVIIEKNEAPLEINDCDDDKSVVEVLEDPVEIEEEDDVVLIAEPVEEIVVDDDADTDDETQAERAERDKLADIDFAKIKIKQEPVEPDDEPVITAEEEAVRATVDTTSTTVLSNIHGNVQLDSRNITNPALSTNGIRINITKLPTVVTRPAPKDISAENFSADEEPLPPGVEPELDFTFKPTLEGVRLSRQPPVTRGMEVSGLCSIM